MSLNLRRTSAPLREFVLSASRPHSLRPHIPLSSPSCYGPTYRYADHSVPAEQVKVVWQGLDTHYPYNPTLFDKHQCREKIYGDATSASDFIFLSTFKWEERKA